MPVRRLLILMTILLTSLTPIRTVKKTRIAFILTKINGGKAGVLNYGISETDAEHVVGIDADTKLEKDAGKYLIERFLNAKENENIAAVAGNIKFRNRYNWLTRWQSIEYTTSQNFDRLAYANINAITVTLVRLVRSEKR